MHVAGPPRAAAAVGASCGGYGQFAISNFSELLSSSRARAYDILHMTPGWAQMESDPAFTRRLSLGSPSREPRYGSGYLNDLLEQIPPYDEPRFLQREQPARSARVQGRTDATIVATVKATHAHL